MQLKVKINNEWIAIPATTEIADDIISDKLTYSSKKIEEIVSNKQDKLSQTQLTNIANVPDKIDKSEVGNGLKFADGILQVDNNSGHNYSTDEQVVGTWIDGKPVYEKTVQYIGNISPNGTSFPHNILNVDKFISLDSLLYSEDYSRTYMGNSYIYHDVNSVNIDIKVTVEAENIKINRSSVPEASDVPYFSYITLQYTKTTDAIPQDVTE